MQLWKFNGGVHVDGHKRISSEQAIVQANIPKLLILPLLQHLGVPTEPIVSIGERVLAGQVIARCRGENQDSLMSAPIHASSSGTVLAIEAREVPHPSGLTAMCIIIETDGKDEWIARQALEHYQQLDPNLVRRHIAQAGVVGLGGAGFPTHIKLKPQGINTLIINGAECEPYITCDDRLMQERPLDVITGAEIMRHVLGGAKRGIIAVEDNKPEAYEALQEALEHTAIQDWELIKIPTLYPSGGARQLIRILLGIEIGRSQQSSEFGIVMHNIETARAVYRAVQRGRPLVSRVVTITGDGVERPQNLEVLLGTPMSELLEACGRKADLERVVMGGGMMGFALSSDEMPVIKTTNCLIAHRAASITPPTPALPCIRCGACELSCPLNLLPQQLYWYARAKDFKKVQEYNIFDCIECGCCAYVCPSNLPLVDYYRYAKAEVREINQENKKAEQAKRRYEFHQLRAEREKQAREARHQQIPVLISDVVAPEAVAEIDESARKKALLQAMLAKAKAKQSKD